MIRDALFPKIEEMQISVPNHGFPAMLLNLKSSGEILMV